MFCRILLISLFATGLVAEQPFSAKVIAISDGDTIKVLRNGASERIRLFGIDCPEKRQAFGSKARALTADLAFGKTVRIIPKDRDRYGRTVAEVALPDGRLLNQELLGAGMAWVYSRYCKDPIYSRIESAARRERRGLWSQPNALPPWEFRRQKQKSPRLAL